jgi:hypothetical protein
MASKHSMKVGNIPDEIREERLRKATSRDPFLHRENKTVEGFNFDMDMFENMIDNFTPMEDIPLLLNVNSFELDKFCQICYNCLYKDAYDILSRRALYYDRMAFNNLAKSGNNSAINVVAKYFMKLDDDNKTKELKIQVVNSIPKRNEGDS